MLVARSVIGLTFGRLVVLDQYRTDDRQQWAVCICSCGKSKDIRVTSLTAGFTESCGCFRSERMAKMSYKHGDAIRGALTSEHIIWHGMRQRCLDANHPAYPNYGGRGITICAAWSDFAKFLEDMGRRPSKDLSIERINNDGPYCKSNCKWGTKSEQARNRRPRRRKTSGQYA